MQAVLYEAFETPPILTTVPDPEPPAHGVVVELGATGVCRSDWHGWMGHDPDVRLPHVPGHELAGTIVALGPEVRRWQLGDRVTVPFVAGCGRCAECHAGQQQICHAQFQPGFTHWGSFAQYVALHQADLNLVRLPDAMPFATAASLGCRFATAFRAVVDQGRLRPGEWLAVYGCGGVGLSAVMIGAALGAQVIAVDIQEEALRLAASLGAVATLNAAQIPQIGAAVRDLSGGGAHVSIDALGHPNTAVQSVNSLRRRGRHVQVGLLLGAESTPPLPMDRVIGHELEIYGSHGMQAHRYTDMLAMIAHGALDPARLIGQCIALKDAPKALMEMGQFTALGATVVTSF